MLGGDFYDAVETPDGCVHLLIGDVSGHGPDEAALGVSLRIAWRTLVLAGMPAQHILPVLDQVLVTERHAHTVFATVAMVSVAPTRRAITVQLAGHPPPMLIEPEGAVQMLPADQLGPPLGVLPDLSWGSVDVAVAPGWSLLAYTDGLIEGRDDTGEPLWLEGLRTILNAVACTSPVSTPTGENGTSGPPDAVSEPEDLLERLLRQVDQRVPHRTDDLAVALIVHAPDPGR
ncbi:PP2C family protein-serine/threonine phosphatase [Pseudonocardia terrae]|uniref:PP2C family protein-serine/threonine phosphatase n=1 Tax=Pseudonocardia terrae TaxID=2905831 RepID=UPI001E4416C3|nr:PP2C family protein-serine/threonine phosphatase [Pseudonocardia terrae]